MLYISFSFFWISSTRLKINQKKKKKKKKAAKCNNYCNTMFAGPFGIGDTNVSQLLEYYSRFDPNWLTSTNGSGNSNNNGNKYDNGSDDVSSLLQTHGHEIFTDIVSFWESIEKFRTGYGALDIHLLFEIEKGSDVYIQNLAGAVGVMYPVNTLRNLALRYARTEFVFLLDADFVPSFDAHDTIIRRHYSYFHHMITSHQQYALIVPAWE
ncbi:hypothetical protein RFI_19800, partial [Reticulomyxa filosa]